ncbi:hypothetical protein SSX86_022702 [Deinandra increscens subsp. villosa]|uniref:DCD domain-containing protein n=1 Tax=Deinandra increscens subsp. villosa TaxID=3103831 RepID=A0AAP0CR45_9ASTR
MGAKKKEFIRGGSNSRNLSKSQLGGVIFGAANTTINECFSKQLFGLPKEHLEYVEKINPGLPLFLFNYTNKKLHGIFEAASHGQKDIDPYAWTIEGKHKTPFPAQVQVRVLSARQPLSENQFKPIIVDNYFSPTHFWFELDHSQTNRLLCLFSSQPIAASLFTTNSSFVSKKVENGLKEKKLSMSFSGETVNSDTLEDRVGTDGKDEKELVCMKLKELAASRKFFEPLTAREDEAAHINVVPHSAALEDETAGKKTAVHENYMTSETSTSLMEDSIIAQLIEKVEDLMAFKTEANHKIGCLERNVMFLEQNLVFLIYLINLLISVIPIKSYTNIFLKVFSDVSCQAEAQNEIRFLKDQYMLENMVGPSEISDTSDINLDLCDDLIYLVGGFDGRSWFSSLDSYSPSNDHIKSLKPMDYARCNAPVSILNGQLYVFGGGTRGVWYDTGKSVFMNVCMCVCICMMLLLTFIYFCYLLKVESYDPIVNEWTSRPPLNSKKGSLAGATLNGKIYAVGGGSDNEFYSSVEMLDLDIGAWIPSRSMLQKRFSLAAAELNGVLYAVGGYDGTNYLKSAERFDPREHSWTRIENMNTTRGCPCLVTLNEKLYVLGGFDGNAMIPSVEVYDPRRGSWMMEEPMKDPRGFAAAAVVKESIYIFGGLRSGEEINHTVECYKEGQGWESVDTKASGRRCFFSAVGLISS